MPSADVVLDTDVLAEVIGQYFGRAERGRAPFEAGGCLSGERARRLNSIRMWAEGGEAVGPLAIASALAFVEMVREWEDIVRGRFETYQLAAFLEQPPEWFSVAPVDEDLVEFFCRVPAHVVTPGGDTAPIEWTDAVHVATLLSRDPNCLLATNDRPMTSIPLLDGRLL